ncbi:MAG TPA: hypothetical protein VL285_00210 [Bryobacteraceae bacterium]|jgi:hypothetical protein|nr:hypothetical protein [Bryobacteraceae bacterium]
MIRATLLVLCPLALAFASDDKTDRASLKGLKAVCTVVEVSDQSQGAVSLSQEQLLSDVRDKLNMAKIPVDKEATACLYLNVRLLPAMGRNSKPIGLYAADFKLEFLQAATLARDPAIRTYASTWSLANMANVPAQDVERTTREIVTDLMEKFVRAYKSVNK